MLVDSACWQVGTSGSISTIMDLGREIERIRQKQRVRRACEEALRDLAPRDRQEVLLELIAALEESPTPAVSIQLRVEDGPIFRGGLPISRRVLAQLHRKPATASMLAVALGTQEERALELLHGLQKAFRVHEREGVWYPGAPDSDEDVPGADEPTVGEMITAILGEHTPNGVAASEVMAELQKRKGTAPPVGYSAAARLIKRNILRREENANGTVTYFLANQLPEATP